MWRRVRVLGERMHENDTNNVIMTTAIIIITRTINQFVHYIYIYNNFSGVQRREKHNMVLFYCTAKQSKRLSISAEARGTATGFLRWCFFCHIIIITDADVSPAPSFHFAISSALSTLLNIRRGLWGLPSYIASVCVLYIKCKIINFIRATTEVNAEWRIGEAWW